MANKKISLHDLVESIMNAVTDTQDKIERQTMDNIQEWFDEDGRPKMVKFKIPSLHPEDIAKRAEGEIVDRELEMPLLTLMQNNPIKIKKLISKFQVDLSGIETVDTRESQATMSEEGSGLYADRGDKPPMGSGDIKRKRKILSADVLGASLFSKQGRQQASIEIEFESGEPTEGYLRLQNELLRLI
ncbi:uncharacterized protein DUF2589 [Sinobacterium caligoides]|uniref:Uncharacterized protein DUF2589 n=1 Tax=Sinobacterium caligoides TaxID=933926 RepID=A0A3N2E0X4_9GAMM|nr:DUF2589 domain-containing protein [Sinobacterium caligoides]ROS05225.1 uncharacterized protein DUF2589 [Sinobacterium caligoides]